MSIGISLAGRYPVTGFLVKSPSPGEWLAKLEEWLRDKEGDDLVSAQVVEGPEGEVLLAQLHPFAEELQVACPGTGEVAVTAATHACGPGYHQHACDLLHLMASELRVAWAASDDERRDDTGFFEGADVEKLEADMVALTAELARDLPDRAPDGPAPSLLLPPTQPGFFHDAAVSTPLGPRDAAWLERVRAGDDAALDAFPWRDRGRSADTWLRRALALMWTEVRWRAPANEAESAVQREVLRCLQAARDKGATDLPWAEWRELAEWNEAEAPGDAGGPARIGYRRGDVLARLPAEFRMRLPGSFSEELDEEGTWSGTDGARAVYVTSGRVANKGDMPGEAAVTLARTAFEGEPFELRGPRCVARAGLRRDTDDDGKELWVLSCGAASGSLLLRATLTFEQDADREWALRCFRSIDRGDDADLAAKGGIAGITSIG